MRALVVVSTVHRTQQTASELFSQQTDTRARTRFPNKTQFTLLLLNTHTQMIFAKLKYHLQLLHLCLHSVCMIRVFTGTRFALSLARFARSSFHLQCFACWWCTRFECNDRTITISRFYCPQCPVFFFLVFLLCFALLCPGSNCIFVHNSKWFNFYFRVR